MELIKKFFADKSRIAILSVCLLMLSVAVVSAMTGETMAASGEMCLQCNNNSNVFKVGTSINPDGRCTVTYKQVDFSECEKRGLRSKIKSLIVKFQLNNGDSISGSTTKSCNYDSSTTTSCSVTGLPTAKRIGYNFKGWGVSSNCTAGVTERVTLYASTDNYTTNYYACWVKKKYTVSYNANGGSGAPSSQVKTYGEKLTLSSIKPTRTGYTFLGWNTNPNTNTPVYKSGGSLSTDANLTLYAVWQSNEGCFQCNTNQGVVKWASNGNADGNCSNGYHNVSGVSSESNCKVYKVSYSANGGSGAPSSQYVLKGKSTTIPSTKPTRTGYTFLGWSVIQVATVANYQPGDSYTPVSNPTFYAVWQEGGTACFKCKGNANLLKWKTNVAGDDSCTVGYEKVAVAQESCKSYVVTYNANGGSNAPSAQYKAHGGTIKLAGVGLMDREGYTFTGWNTKSDGSGTSYASSGATYSSNSSVTLYAMWKKEEITYKVNINYKASGGSVAELTDAGKWKLENDFIYFDGAKLTTTLKYGTVLGTNGLVDYYSGVNLKVTKTGYDAVVGAEWICLEGCTTANKTFNISTRYSHSDFCDASKKDCTVVLGVNWATSKVNIKYNTGGGHLAQITDNGNKKWTVANDAIHLNGNLLKTTVEYGSELGGNGLYDYDNLANLYINKAGYKAKPGAEWRCAYGDCEVGKTYDQSKEYSHSDFCDASKGNCIIVLAVNWVPNKVDINYNSYGGTVQSQTDAGSWTVKDNLIYKNGEKLTTTVNYGEILGENGLVDHFSGVNLRVTKAGYDAKPDAQWVCLSGDCTKGETYDYSTQYSYNDFCDITSDDCSVVLGVNWIPNKINIKYSPSDGNLMESTDNGNKKWETIDGEIWLNGALHTTTVEYGSKLGENGLTDYNSLANLYVTKTGYSAKAGAEWICLSGGCTKGKTYSHSIAYNHNDFCDASKSNCEVLLGVNWVPNKVNIKYNTNGGTIKVANGYSVKDDLVYKDNEVFISTINYDGSTSSDGISNYNNSSHISITRVGYSVPVDEEWVCLSGDCEAGTTYGQSIVYEDDQFCEAENRDCTVVLGVNWQVNEYNITYNGNGSTSGFTESSSHEYDISKNLTKNGFTRTGYTFTGWNTKADGSGTSYTDGQSVKNLSSTNGATVNLYAQWKGNNYTVKYDANGGTGTMSDSMYTYGVSKALSANSFSRTDYTFKCWNTKADGSGVNYTDKQSIKIAENLTLYAQWRSNDSTDEEEEIEIKYYIRYDKNGGIGTMKNSEHKYGYASNLTKNAFIKIGYTFNGWNTKADGTGTTYTDGETISNLASNNGDIVTLYAQWSEIVREEVPTTPDSGSDNSGNQGNNNSNNNIDKSPQTGMLATILVSLIGIGAFGGVVYYRKKVKI